MLSAEDSRGGELHRPARRTNQREQSFLLDCETLVELKLDVLLILMTKKNAIITSWVACNGLTFFPKDQR